MLWDDWEMSELGSYLPLVALLREVGALLGGSRSVGQDLEVLYPCCKCFALSQLQDFGYNVARQCAVPLSFPSHDEPLPFKTLFL